MILDVVFCISKFMNSILIKIQLYAIGFMVCTLLCTTYAHAQIQGARGHALLSQIEYKPLKLTGRGEVVQIINPQTVQLKDGRTIRLSALHFPDLDMSMNGDYALMAKKIMEDFLQGKHVLIYQTPEKDWGRVNRMGHHLAHLQREDGRIWLQGLLLSLGLAQVNTDERTPELSAQMYEVENLARHEKIGVWAEDKYQIHPSEHAHQFMDRFQIIEGRILDTAIKNNRIYLNFGKDWRDDFTLSVPANKRQVFKKKNVDPLSWKGQYVRARGWVRDYNGAFMEITHPQAVSTLDEP